jgi:N-acetylglutamate synthase-like GNAT family acetyltransferase
MIRPLKESDRFWVKDFLTKEWGSTQIITRGRFHHADELPGFLWLDHNEPVGLVTYGIDRDQCELVTLNSLVDHRGVGTALVAAVREVAVAQRCRRLWLVTTNDNCRALIFYQKCGFVLTALHRNTVVDSRRLKPEIPIIGIDGITIRDEIEMEMLL